MRNLSTIALLEVVSTSVMKSNIFLERLDINSLENRYNHDFYNLSLIWIEIHPNHRIK